MAASSPRTEPQVWRNTDDVIEGWDWSLPPGTRPSPRGWVSWGGKDNLDYNLPAGNRVVDLKVAWRELEPVEGQYDFEPLRKVIQEIGRKGLGVSLHVYASVWKISPWAPPGREPATNRDPEARGSAPRWLTNYAIPFITEKPIENAPSPFQIVNFDIFHPEYHARYLRFMRALGRSGIPHLPEVKAAYIHDKSATNGEEGWTEDDQPTAGDRWQRYQERLEVWAEAFGPDCQKLMTVSAQPHVLNVCYRLGIGQRNGFVEHYLGQVQNPLLGQSVDEDGYLVVDETCPLIARNLASGDENEEYSQGWVSRFGPYETFPHRYRESMLRVLQMRRSYLLIDGSDFDPGLLNYVSLELGRTAADTPDAWCYLRESVVKQGRQGMPVKNFERWLHQRDTDDAHTEATEKVEVPPQMFEFDRNHLYDLTARKTQTAKGQSHIRFGLDDAFLSGGPHRVAVKVTYADRDNAAWELAFYKSAADRDTRKIACGDSGVFKTATLILPEIWFPRAVNYGGDLEIRALKGDAVIRMVRVIKLNP